LAAAAPLVHELVAAVDARPRPAGERRIEIHADLRYVGQEHTLTIAVPQEGDGLRAGAELELLDGFAASYAQTFGHTMDEAVEIVTFRVTATTPLPRGAAAAQAARGVREDEQREAYSFRLGERRPFAVVDRAALEPGTVVAGPAIVHEPTATTYLDAGFTARVHQLGHLVVEREPGPVEPARAAGALEEGE
jgi:N-methylhydantoinase A